MPISVLKIRSYKHYNDCCSLGNTENVGFFKRFVLCTLNSSKHREKYHINTKHYINPWPGRNISNCRHRAKVHCLTKDAKPQAWKMKMKKPYKVKFQLFHQMKQVRGNNSEIAELQILQNWVGRRWNKAATGEGRGGIRHGKVCGPVMTHEDKPSEHSTTQALPDSGCKTDLPAPYIKSPLEPWPFSLLLPHPWYPRPTLGLMLPFLWGWCGDLPCTRWQPDTVMGSRDQLCP